MFPGCMQVELPLAIVQASIELKPKGAIVKVLPNCLLNDILLMLKQKDYGHSIQDTLVACEHHTEDIP